MSDLVRALRERAASEPNRIAFRFLVDGEGEEALLTYAQLDLRARQVAASLLDRGAKGERVLLVQPPGLAYIESLFGCFYAGAVAVPAYPPRFQQQAEGLRATAIDAQAKFALGPSVELEGIEWISPSQQAIDEPRENDGLALLQYTSGSTRAPRGVMLTQRHLAKNAQLMIAGGGFTREDSAVSWLPPYHDMGLIGFILTPVIAGGACTLLSPYSFLLRPMRWLRALTRYRATVTGGPDFAYRLCAQRATEKQLHGLDLSHLRIAMSGAERVRPQTLDAFAKTFAPAGLRREALRPCYGLAEATLAVTFSRHGPKQQGDLMSCGAPLPETEVRIVDAEIQVKSPAIAAGYWGKPELTAETFVDGWLRTGDLGFLEEGELYIEGRRKDVLIFRGRNHFPDDIEATALEVSAALRGAAAISVEHAGEEKLVLLVERDRGEETGLGQALRAAIAEKHELPIHELLILPSRALPRTTSNKLQRSLAKERYLARQFHPLAEPQLEIEPQQPELLPAAQQLFQSVLGVERVSPDDDFFALGGHSLMGAQLVTRAKETLGIALPLRDLFGHPTPRLLARKLAQAPRAEPPPPLALDKSLPLPLSFSQQRMWYLAQLEPQSSAYNVGGALLLEGPLDASRFEESLQKVIDRHEVLRSNYPAVDGEPRAVIAKSLRVPLPAIDLTNESDPLDAAAKLSAAVASLPFDLAKGSLVRASLYKLGPERHAICVSLHHIVADGWALGVLLEETLRFYRGDAPSSQASWFEHAAWERQQLGAQSLKEGLRWWKDKLKRAPILQLPVDNARPAKRTSAGGLLRLEIEPSLFDSLRDLSRAHGATLSMTMLAAFEILLFRLTGQADLVVGTPVANRARLASESLIGTLVNTLPLRFQVEGEESFVQQLRRLREELLEAWAHEQVPFERIVAELQLERSASLTPLFQVMFDFQNWPMPDSQIGSLRMKPLFFSPGASQFDLSLFVLDTTLGSSLGLAYSTELFERDTAERIGAYYVRILREIVAEPSRAVGRIPLLSPGEAAALTQTRPLDAPRELVHRLFEQQVQRTPEAIAVLDRQGPLTYRELDARANGVARKLRELGAGPGERIGVLLDRSREVLVALLAVLKTGAAYVPLDPRFPAARLKFLLEDCDARALVSTPELRNRLAPNQPCAFVAECPPEDAPPSALPGGDSPAYIIYTSGSTGRPKGVVVGHFGVANFLRSMAREPGLHANDRILSVTSISFDIAALELFLPLTLGASVYIAPPEAIADGWKLAELIESSHATVMQATPSTWRMLLDAGWKGKRSLKVLCGGEALPRDLANLLLPLCDELWNLYGPTETTIWSALHRVREGKGAVPIGRTIDNTSLYILDAHGTPVPRGVSGELFIGGAGVAHGYFQRPDLTEQRFVRDPFSGGTMYRTGDAARLRLDGEIDFLGRLDQQIKLRGHRVEPGEIESVLREHPAVRDAVVVVRGERLVAYYVAQGETPDLRERCRRRLPEHMIPSALVRLEALPLTPNGKIDRNALPEPAHDPSGERAIGPRDPLEERVAQIWSSVLGAPAPGVRESFFLHGGDSLLAVRLVAELERKIGIALPLSTLAEGPTIEQMANSIRMAQQQREVPPLKYVVALQPKGKKPPLFCVHGAGGNVLNLPELVQALGDEQPFYGLQASGVDGLSDDQKSIEAMAAAYLAEVRLIQPRGPYYLSGYCGGGLIAWEMARQLRAARQEVGALMLIDLRSPGSEPPRNRLREWWHKFTREDAMQLWQRARAKVFRDVGRSWASLLVKLHRLSRKPLPYWLREHWMMQTFLQRANRYVVPRQPGKVIVFRAHDAPDLAQREDLGWSRFSDGEVEAYEVPGDHHSLTHGTNVEILAAHIAILLRDARRD